jgi:hypothetical protein
MRQYDFPTFTGANDSIADERIRKSHTAKLYLAIETGDIILVIPEDCWGEDGVKPILDNLEWDTWTYIVAEHPMFVRERYVEAHNQWYEHQSKILNVK